MEKVYEVIWDGPFTSENIKSALGENMQKYALYSVYGSHPIYGNNILLYIGKTERGVLTRLSEHDFWMDQERFGLSQIFVASIGEFKDWEQSNKTEIYDLPDSDIIDQIEKLLIYAVKPVHNEKCKKSVSLLEEIRIFNTNNYGSLFPEISSLLKFRS